MVASRARRTEMITCPTQEREKGKKRLDSQAPERSIRILKLE